ncbi:MAG: hypothetical protein ABW185_14210 [Sedimenticola sp.]
MLEKKIPVSVTTSDSTIILDKTEKVERDSDPSKVVIVDKLVEPFRTSQAIRQELNRFADLKPEFGYSLSGGGVALQFATSNAATSVLEKWPTEAFGKDSKPHRPRAAEVQQCRVGFLKNIDPKISVTSIASTLGKDCKINSSRRLYNRKTKRPIPIVRIEFASASDLQKAKVSNLDYIYRNAKSFVEEERRFKVIRCFRCHAFGHIARGCTNDTSCEKCGSTDHITDKCTQEEFCSNCGGGHAATSSKCPDYIRRFQSLQSRHCQCI